MKYGTAFGFRLLVGSLVGVLALAPLGAARAQTLDDGMDKLGKEYDKHKAVLTGLHRGDPAFDGSKAHKDAVDVAAKYYTYRFYLGHYEQPDPSQKYAYEHYRILYDDFDKEVKNLLDPRARGKVEALIPEFSRQVGVHALEVLKYSGEKVAPIVKVNIVRVLARLADLGQPDLADTLVEVLQDNGLNDGARYYAFRGLHNLLAVPAAPQAAPRLNKEREAKVAGAVVDFLNQKAPVDDRSPREEVDGYRLLRREAVRVLAGLHNPTAGKARPALELARFAGNDERINPRPRLDERLEAAIGLAGMRPDAEKLYQPEYAAYQIGQFVSNFGAAAAGELGTGVTGSAKRRPWKVDAVRLADALDGMKAAYPTNKYVGDMVAKAMPVLAKVERWDRNNLPDTSSLRQWLSSSEPPASELFKGDKDSVVKTGSEEEPEKPADKPAKSGDKPKGKPTDKPKGKPTGKPGDKPAGKPKK